MNLKNSDQEVNETLIKAAPELLAKLIELRDYLDAKGLNVTDINRLILRATMGDRCN